jgi:hypothetical protein
MCYGCTWCGKCGKLEHLANNVAIPCLKCGAAVDPATGICTKCAHQAFVPTSVLRERSSRSHLKNE